MTFTEARAARKALLDAIVKAANAGDGPNARNFSGAYQALGADLRENHFLYVTAE